MSDVELWTAQGIGYSLTDEQYDPAKARFEKDAAISAAYTTLCDRLGVASLVWCYSQRPDKFEHDTWTRSGAVWYHLRVPKSAVLTYIDDARWLNIIDKRTSSAEMREDIWRRAMAIHNEALSFDAACAAVEAEIWAAIGSKEDCWAKLAIPAPSATYGSSALLTHPIDRSWVVKSPWPRAAAKR